MKQFAFIILALGFLGGCAMKTKILDASAVSMTHMHLKPGESLKETVPVTGKFCADTFGDKGSIGLIDESVKAAQQQFSVDYILNASFWNEGACISVEGTGAKVMASAGATESAPVPAAKPSSKKKTQ